MSIAFFNLLFLVLTADGLMVFLIPVVVYMLTGSIEYSGLSYAIWWLPRIILIPLIGRCVDSIGVKPLSIFSDLVKILGCSFLMLDLSNNPLLISISFGIVGSLISIGNSQTMIVYEKLIAKLSLKKEHHVNLMSRMDFLGMIIGTSLGMLLIDYGYRLLLVIPCLFYMLNAMFFIFRAKLSTQDEDLTTHEYNDDQTVSKKHASLKFILASPILLFAVGLAVGNNMFDGVIESSGTSLIDRNMNLPIKYFGLIDICAGIFGLLGTFLYSFMLNRSSRFTLLLLGLFVIVIPSVILALNPDSIWVLVICYSLTIVGKVITGNLNRIIRIEVIPVNILASTSSMIILLCQSILPVVGLALFLSNGKQHFIFIMLAISIIITTMSGLFLLRNIRMRLKVAGSLAKQRIAAEKT